MNREEQIRRMLLGIPATANKREIGDLSKEEVKEIVKKLVR